MSNSPSPPGARGPDFTPDNWQALMFVWTLFSEVAIHGKRALDTFLRAAKEMRV